MRIISKKTLAEFSKIHPDAKSALETWFSEASNANWNSFQDIKDRYASADVISGNRVVFNIRGNNYRMVVKIHYNTGVIYIRFIGTHAEYNKINVEQI